ncbi:TonB-dependent receptor [Cyclobacterium marinum]|uniref:TonB-dependent receptor n=1 Tax=Cyclobacterium marinum TaxID=104 RepID=UPI0011F09857|nr:TonB-dependent receptor [Cyclobacterium marinum]MBI0398366.1 TonB-dependent receptor [Cyclobacterium marinum]
MKNNNQNNKEKDKPGINRAFRVMKLTMFLLVFSVITVLAEKTYSQTEKLNLAFNNYEIREVLHDIEAQSEYYFMFSEKIVDVKRKISIDAKNESIDVVLDKMFSGTNVEHAVRDRYIILTTNEISGNNILAQEEKVISGTVTGEDGETIPGVNVIVKGTAIGAVSDLDGKYTIQVPDENSILIFSYLGYAPQEVEVGNRSVIDLVLTADIASLEEVVVVGYGTARRKDISGAVGTVKLEDSELALSASSNALQSLQGTVAGVNVAPQTSPGSTPGILVRGQNSINGSNSPLIVLDGIIYLGSLTDINPDDIAVIDVLKDASAAAVYGSRSANGVIVITTKSGKSNKPIIKYDGSFGINRWQNQFDMMNLERWTEKYVAQTPSIESPSEIVFDDVTRTRLFAQGVDTDWMDLISRNGAIQNHQVSVSGKSDKINYYFSGGYNTNEGAIVGDDYQRISIRSKLDADVTSWLKVGIDGAYNNNDYSGIGANVARAYQMAPMSYPYRWDAMPENPESNTGTLLERYPTGSSIPSPLWDLSEGVDDIDKRNFYRLATYALVKVPKIEGLTYRFNYSINANNNVQDRFYHENYYIQEQLVEPFIQRYSPTEVAKTLAQANGYNRRTNYHTYVMDNIINYNKQLGEHYLDATLVATRDFSYTKTVEASGNDFSDNGNTLLGVNGIHKATVQRNNLTIVERANIGYVGRIGYSYRDRYNLTATVRRDGSSVFGAEKKWGNFPSIGVSWTISEEEFLKGDQYLDYLKVKASYGQNGNQGVSPYGTLAPFASGSGGGIRYEFGDAPSTILYGISQSGLGNPNLGWETTTAFNGGFQSAWLNGNVLFDLDFYFSSTTDQIFVRQIPIMTGFSSIISSLGQVDNRGIEISLRTTNISNKNFTWTSGLMFWKNRNKLVELYGDDNDGDGVEDDDLSNGLFIGKPLNGIYGYVYNGVVQEADTEYIENTGAVPGDAKFKDLSGPEGVPDGIITADYDRQILGYRQENFRLSLSNTLKYKNFSFYVMLSGIFGGGKDNYYQRENPRHNSFNNRFDTNEIDHDWWTPENQSEYYLRPDFNGNRYLGLMSRGFLRIQDINLSYELPKGMLSGISVSSVKVYGSIYNLYSFTDWYGGGDAESGIRPGDNAYPVPTTYSMGLQVGF